MKIYGGKLMFSDAASRNGAIKMLEVVARGGNQTIVENRYIRRLRKKVLQKPTK